MGALGKLGTEFAWSASQLVRLFTRDRFLWGIHADGLVRGIGDAAQPYGLPMPFSTWLFLWIEALEAVFDDEDAGEQFFRIDA